MCCSIDYYQLQLFDLRNLSAEWLSRLTNSLKTRDRSTTGEERLDHLAIYCTESDFANKVAFAAKVGNNFAVKKHVKNYALKEFHIALQLYHLAFQEAVTVILSY